MTSKELWASKLALREKPWKSNVTGAGFIIRQPDSGETIKLVSMNLEVQKDPEKLRDVIVYVWTRCVLDPESREPAFTVADDSLIMRGDFGELIDVMNQVFEMLPSTDKASVEAMRKNSRKTRAR